MSKEDEIFYMLKHGHHPKFRIEKYSVMENSEAKLKYVLTNLSDEDYQKWLKKNVNKI